jgi:dihydroorotate dehydrogenase
VIGYVEPFLRPLLGLLDAETAHRVAICALKLQPRAEAGADDPRLGVPAFGLNFPNPIGMAAGFDKHAEVPDALLRLGFGFVEVGTVTVRPQRGNTRPRVFRLPLDEAVINRLGFNSDGAEAVLQRLAGRAEPAGIVGINIGPNRGSADRIGDYVRLLETFAPVASYFALNVSSPNTPGLRELQQGETFDTLLARIMEARACTRGKGAVIPILIKIAPDLMLSELDNIVSAARRYGADGMIVANTTLARPSSLSEKVRAREAGGLSGRPLFALATRMLAETYMRVEGAFPLIGVGGVDSGEAALVKIRAGASLVELYSALVFKGLGLLSRIKFDLCRAMSGEGHASIPEIVGRDAAAITAGSWPL